MQPEVQQFQSYLNSVFPMSEEDFNLAIPFFQVEEIVKGDHLVRSGERCNKVAFVVSGIFRIYFLKDGTEVNTCFCGENSITSSFASLTSGEPSEENIQALEDCTVVVLGRENLMKLYSLSPAWQAIGRLLTEKECLRLSDRASSLSFDTALEKYKNLLRSQPDVVNRIAVKEIASYLGVTRETLSRIRAKVAS